MRQFYPEFTEVEPYAAYGADLPADSLRANMISSIDGAAAVEGRVGQLTGAADQQILHTLRALADVILVGAQTVRVEGYADLALPDGLAERRVALGLPATPTLAIVTRSGRLHPGSPVFLGEGPRPILIVPGGLALPGELRDAAQIVVAGDAEVDLAGAVRELRTLGHRRILSEGGPRTLGALLAADLVDELCLTTSAQVAGGDGDRPVSGVPGLAQAYALTRLLYADGALFARWRRDRRPESSGLN